MNDAALNLETSPEVAREWIREFCGPKNEEFGIDRSVKSGENEVAFYLTRVEKSKPLDRFAFLNLATGSFMRQHLSELHLAISHEATHKILKQMHRRTSFQNQIYESEKSIPTTIKMTSNNKISSSSAKNYRRTPLVLPGLDPPRSITCQKCHTSSLVD